MTTVQINAWIFLSAAMTADGKAATESSIRSAADYINHAFPSDEELKPALNWLIQNELLVAHQSGYILSKQGITCLKRVQKKSKQLLKQWSLLEIELERFKK